MKLDPKLLYSEPLPAVSGIFEATLKAHGLYNSFHFVLRLSPRVHRTLAQLPAGIVSVSEVGFDGTKAFSTLLHETVHWWQHVGSTHGLMRSLSYPAQSHINHRHLKALLNDVGFKKSIRQLALTLPQSRDPETACGRANVIVNNHFDFQAFLELSFQSEAAKAIIGDPYFESAGHAYHMTYANNMLLLALATDPNHRAIQDPRLWEAPFRKLQEDKEEGFYYGSPVTLWPVGARDVFEGQAMFIQIQYLACASGGRLGWDDFRDIGMLNGIYVRAFEEFLRHSELEWPPIVDHPTVALFLLICDMAINPGVAFSHPLENFDLFLLDVDPGARFTFLSTAVRLYCRDAAVAITNYSREEYAEVSEKLSAAVRFETPLSIAEICSGWTGNGAPASAIMNEYRTYNYGRANLPVRVLFSHFLALMCDKLASPEFFCWAGAWMAGERVSERAAILFDRHGALFVDKEDNDGILPRLVRDRDERSIQRMFDSFYASNITYDMTDQWIGQPGPFVADYRWLVQSGSDAEVKAFADGVFEQVYGVRPDAVEALP